MKDKFKAVWLSHSSIGDFLKCPRLYYLRNVYKDPATGHKMTVMTPPLALGAAVHEILDSLSTLPAEERFSISLVEKLNIVWEKMAGEKGGFRNTEHEQQYKERAVQMLKNIEKNPGLLLSKAIKIKSDSGLPYYWFSEDENIILCGKVDWIEYLDDDTIHIIDFKTGRGEEDEASLQLPIYLLLTSNTQKRKIARASYWYLNQDVGLVKKTLPDIEVAKDKVGKIASRIKLARQLGHFKCPTDGCKHCYPLEEVLKNHGKLVGVSEYGQDIFILDN